VAKRRGQETLGDMVRTVIVFLVIIVAAVAFLPKSHHPGNQQVDYSGPLQVLRAAAPFPVLAPQGLPAGWTATNVRTHVPSAADRSTSFHLGFYVAAVDAYAAYEQSDAPNVESRVLGAGAHPTGRTDVAGVAYQTWADNSGGTALVGPAPGRSTVVVYGKGSAPALRTLAAALR
jgi:hypothetical protein